MARRFATWIGAIHTNCFAWIHSQTNLMFERFARIVSNLRLAIFFCLETRFAQTGGGGVRLGNPETIRANQAISESVSTRSLVRTGSWRGFWNRPRTPTTAERRRKSRKRHFCLLRHTLVLSFRNRYILNLKTIESCNCNLRKFLRIISKMALQKCNVNFSARILGWIFWCEFWAVNFLGVNFWGGSFYWKT